MVIDSIVLRKTKLSSSVSPEFPFLLLGEFQEIFFETHLIGSPMDTKSKAVTTETSGVLRAVRDLGTPTDAPPHLDTEDLSVSGTFLSNQARNIGQTHRGS